MASDLGSFCFVVSCGVWFSLVIASGTALEAGSSGVGLGSAVSHVFYLGIGWGGGGDLYITLWKVFIYHGWIYGEYLIRG